VALTSRQTAKVGFAQQAPADSMTTPAWEVAAIAVLLGFYILADNAFGQDSYEIINFFGPLSLAVVLILGSIRMVLIEPNAMWTGIFWFRVATAIYFGVGSIIHNYFNDYTMIEVWKFFYAEKEHIAKFNIITALSVLCVLGTAAVLGRIFPARRDRTSRAGSDERLLFVTGVLFAICGYLVKYLIAFPQAMGVFGDFVFPGIVGMLELCAPVALFLLTLWSVRCAPAWLPVMAGLLTLDMIAGFLRFSKSDVLLPLLMFILALLHNKASLVRIMVAAIVFTMVYQTIEPTAGYGRQELSIRYGTIRSSSFEERLEIMAKYWNDISLVRSGEQFQGALARIAYVHSAAPAIALYDRGASGSSLEDVYYVLIPRFLWPDKPVFDHGARYTQLINGTNMSSTWMGYFGEAYWNLGWPGIPLLMIPLGAVFFCFGRYTQFVLLHGKWLHFPAVFLGMFLGIRVDGSLVTEVFVTSIIAIVYHFVANAGTTVLRRVLLSGAEPSGPPVGYLKAQMPLQPRTAQGGMILGHPGQAAERPPADTVRPSG
jgi:hypothetical protein